MQCHARLVRGSPSRAKNIFFCKSGKIPLFSALHFINFAKKVVIQLPFRKYFNYI